MRHVPSFIITSLIAAAAPLAAQVETPALHPDGQIRLRGEWDGRSEGAGDDAAVLSRVRAGLGVTFEDWLRAYLQIQDARAWGSEFSTLADGSADQLDLHQGFVQLGRADSLYTRMGRQQLVLADERLVGAVGWTNTGRVFDGVRGAAIFGPLEVTAFWMNVAEGDALLPTGLNPQLNEGEDEDGWLVGAFANHPLAGGMIELAFLHDRNGVTDESYTANLRLHGSRRRVLYEGAAAYQFGPDRSAFLLSGRLGYRARRATLMAQIDYLSGDGDPDDGERRAFHTLYATNHKFYGLMDYFVAFPAGTDAAGLIDLMLRGRTRVAGGWDLALDLHYFATARERLDRHALGFEADLVGRNSLSAHATLELGLAFFVPGELAGDLLPAFSDGSDVTYWGYTQLLVGWP